MIPGAAKNQVVAVAEGILKVKIHAQPEKGKANDELLHFLAELLNLRKSSLTVVQGLTSRNKLVAVSGCATEELTARLQVLGAVKK